MFNSQLGVGYLCILNFAYVCKNQEKIRNISFIKLDVVNKRQNDNDKITDGDDDIDEVSYEMNLDGYNDGEDESEKIAERANLIQKIIVGTDVPDLQPDEWVAVIIGSQWYPAQFETYDKESEQIKVNVLHRSSTDPKWFIWPQLDLNGAEHVE